MIGDGVQHTTVCQPASFELKTAQQHPSSETHDSRHKTSKEDARSSTAAVGSIIQLC